MSYAHKIKVSLPAGKIEKIEDFILSLKNIEITSYLTSDYANPNTTKEIIITGLILGYPVETTVAILWMS